MKIGVVNYGMGNLHSVLRKLKVIGAEYSIIDKPEDFNQVDKIILPGVGHFGKAMENLKSFNLISGLNHAVLIEKKPILGICLGMQIMCDSSEEGDAKGLGWIEGDVKRFRIKDQLRFKVPHMGWNKIICLKESALLKNIPDLSEFYFVHSFHFISGNSSNNLMQTDYEYEYISAFEKDNIYGVQFHPEKSFDAGNQLFKNFVNL